jgi:4-carboxymuconolactone decarboxylase
MKRMILMLAALVSVSTHSTTGAANALQNTVSTTRQDFHAVAPALERYTNERLLGEVWKRPGLDARDRSIITLAALIARQDALELPFYLNRALDNGVNPSEISEIITHLAFYSGWTNAAMAASAAKDVFAARNIDVDQLPAANGPRLPVNKAAEAERSERVERQFGAAFPGLVQYTTDILFRDLWLRPGLTPRDRSLVTVSALIASGQLGQFSSHLERAMENGLTAPQVSEAITQLAFYAGWPAAFSAMPLAKAVLEKRARPAQ